MPENNYDWLIKFNDNELSKITGEPAEDIVAREKFKRQVQQDEQENKQNPSLFIAKMLFKPGYPIFQIRKRVKPVVDNIYNRLTKGKDFNPVYDVYNKINYNNFNK